MKYQKLLSTTNEKGTVQYFNPDYVKYVQATATPSPTRSGILVGTTAFWDMRTPEEVVKAIQDNENLRTK